GRVERGGRRLRREPLVAVLVAVHHELRAIRVEGVPHRLKLGVAVVARPGRRKPAGFVPVGEGAAPGAGRDVLPLPLLLSGLKRYVERYVDGYEEPIDEVVAVVTLRGITGGGAEVAEVSGGPRRRVLVVPGHRVGARLVPSPGGVVAVGVVGRRAVRISV